MQYKYRLFDVAVVWGLPQFSRVLIRPRLGIETKRIEIHLKKTPPNPKKMKLIAYYNIIILICDVTSIDGLKMTILHHIQQQMVFESFY